MDSWPVISEPELRARMALADEEFADFLQTLMMAVGVREFTEDIYMRALGYPWPRPAWSFVLDGDDVRPLAELSAEVVEELMDDRWPLLAFGSNGAPERLGLKFGHLPAQQRRLLVVAGDLHDFDVGVSAHPTIYGAMPGTIFPSPGTVVRASVLWVTAEQLTALAWTELSYGLGRLDGIRFDPDEPGLRRVECVLAFVSRFGAHRIDGEVAALAAIPAVGRQAPAYTQEQLLDDLALRALGPDATARDLVMRLMEDFGACATEIGPMLRATALAFDSPHWTPYPGEG